jgi:energy-converting hydrogenase A subunit R
MGNVQLDTACEGPLALNDNTFELCREFIKPHGDRLFRRVSRYDQYLAQVARRPGYQAGSALKLLAPFLKVHGLTNDRIKAYARKNISLMPGAEAAFRFLNGRNFPIFAFSANGRPFAEAVGQKLGFNQKRLFATELDLDRYTLSAAETEELLRLQEEITAAAAIEWSDAAETATELPAPVAETVARLDRIFGERMPAMEMGALWQEVSPMAGPGKAKAVAEALAQTHLSLADTIYVGADGTDVHAFEAVRTGGGLAISFNGDREAVNAATVIVVADTAWPLALLTAIFQLWGKDGVLEVASPETRAKSRSLVLPEAVIEPIGMGLEGHQFNLYDQNAAEWGKVVGESEAMRAKLPGEAIAGRE